MLRAHQRSHQRLVALDETAPLTPGRTVVSCGSEVEPTERLAWAPRAKVAAAALIWGALCPVRRVRQPLQPSLEGLPLPLMGGPVTSVSMSTRGHSHMRGLVPQDGLFGGSGTAGSSNERGPGGAAHSAVAGSLLTLPSPALAHQRTLHAGACGSRAVGALLRERGEGQRGARAAQRA